MAGEATLDELTAYVSRLTGQEQSADAPLALRSVHRAALASWARSRKLTLRLAAMSSGAPFTLRALLADAPAPSIEPKAAVSQPKVLAVGGPGVGIDIEDVANLPEAADYRAHVFYQDNFSPAEIARCLRQADVRASFCGVWAAKEAIVKSGLASAPDGKLRGIEIGWDGSGRPVAAGCQLSISHTASTAVAVCIVAQAQVAAPAPVVAVVQTEAVPERKRRSRALVAASVVAVAIIAGLAFTYTGLGVHLG
jgi:phosphopantetheine--protein transferase-like protein